VRSLLAAVAGGALSILAFPPYGVGVLIVPAVVLFLVSIRWASRPSLAWTAGWTYGLVSFGFLFPWLAELGVIAFLPLLVVQAAYPAVYARLLFAARHWGPGGWWIAATGGWALMELARERFPIGGFPWGMAGYPLGEYAAARGATQWIGTSGWSVAVAWLAAALALVVTAPPIRGTVVRLTAASTGVFLALVVAGGVVPSGPDGREVRVAIVQGSTPCPGSRCPDERYRTYQNHLRLTRGLEAGTLDLVVWPEGSMGGFTADPINSAEVRQELSAEVARLGSVLLAGTDRPLDDAHWVNANIVFDRTGVIVGEYRKRHPVPFGEYIPGRPLFSWIEALDAVPRDMIPGHGPVVFDLGFGPFGSVISFEGSFSRYARDAARSGARLLVVATNQGSYPLSNASDQLIAMTRMRAAELGVDVVHGAVTGRSTLITDGGVTGRRTPLAEEDVVIGTVRMRESGPTPYTRLGDWLQLAGVAALVVAAGASAGRPGQGG
jgi:apolipoprotein N-acyltransferase